MLKCVSFQIFHEFHEERVLSFVYLFAVYTARKDGCTRFKEKNGQARLREGKQLRVNRVYESTK